MNEYKRYIKTLADEGRDVVFYNSSSAHAAIVMGTMFAKADNSIKLYAGSLSGDISGKSEYKKGLENYLRRGGKLEILLQRDKFEKVENEPEIFKLFRMFSILNKDQITVKLHSQKIARGKDEIHFMVADKKMYRIEDDIDNYTAVGNFKDIITSNRLTILFDNIFSASSSTTLAI